MSSKGLSGYLTNLLGKVFARMFRNFYYSAKESIGEHKRDIVVYQVEQACTSLQDTRNEFEDALAKFKSLVYVSESSLEHRYNMLNRQYQFCRAKSDTVSNRIRAIEDVSQALFAEWEHELNEYTDRNLKNSSRQQLKEAKQNYAKLIKTMRQAETKIHPVLAAFKDQVLFLKHNLNARAISALHHEFTEIAIDIAQLIQAMEMTIVEANRFVTLISPQKKLALRRP
jgi:predicted  nucleic acid-binding Zn-ribbon protein